MGFYKKLVSLYETGNGIKADLSKALYRYGLSSQQNHIPSLTRLSRCYATGVGFPQDLRKATELIGCIKALGKSDIADKLLDPFKSS